MIRAKPGRPYVCRVLFFYTPAGLRAGAGNEGEPGLKARG